MATTNIKHRFVSGKSDGGDATLARPSDWNNDHSVSGTCNLSDADIVKAKRWSDGGGTALVAGDFALSAGWGSTAAVSAVTGADGSWNITITTGGTGIAANPTIALTFKDGTWTSSPIVISKMVGGTGVIADLLDSSTATVWTMTFQGLPITGKTYIISGIARGRT